jgi:hypothetical protein
MYVHLLISPKHCVKQKVINQPVRLAGCWWLVLICFERKYCWLVAGGWFVLREKYCWLVADKPSEQGEYLCSLIQGTPYKFSYFIQIMVTKRLFLMDFSIVT